MNKLSDHDYLKNLILEFYENLKEQDKLFGKNICFEDFKQSSFDVFGFYDYYDQAKYLFLNEVLLMQDEISEKKFRNAIIEGSEIKDPSEQNFVMQKALEKRMAEQSRTLRHKNKLNTIGKADLFRYQFVNLVDEIVFCDNVENNILALYETSCGRLSLYKFSGSETVFDPNNAQCFSDKCVIFHELTHILALKTLQNGTLRFITPYFFSSGEKLGIMLDNNLKYNSIDHTAQNINKTAFYSFEKGNRILNELATDFFSLSSAKTLGCVEIENNYFRYDACPQNNSISFQEGEKETFFHRSSYMNFGHLLELILASKGNFENVVPAKTSVPCCNIFNEVVDYLKKGKISKEVQEILNDILKNAFDINDDVLALEHLETEKFFMLFGLAYDMFETAKHNKLKDMTYNKYTQFLQTVLLDIHKNKFFAELNAVIKIGDANKIREFLIDEIKKVERMNDWIIKPNINLAKDQVKPVWARNVVSCSELNDLDHYQNSQLTVWVIHLQNLCKLAHKFDPSLVEGSPLLKKELEYLNAQALSRPGFEK